MKTRSLLKKVILTTGYLGCLQISTTFAYFTTDEPIVGGNVNTMVVGLGDNAIKAFDTIMGNLYRNIVALTADLLYAFDTELPKTIVQNNTFFKTKDLADKDVSEDINKTISSDLSDDKIKDLSTSSLSEVNVEDDVTSVFEPTPPAIKHGPYGTGYKENDGSMVTKYIDQNKKLNVDAFLAPYKYTPDQKQDALDYLFHLENSAPSPTVLRISKSFELPYTDNPNNSSGKTSIVLPKPDNSIGKSRDKHTLDELKKFLRTNDAVATKYRNYKVTYRSQIAAKTMFLSNLIRSYQSRVEHNGVSVTELKHQEATRRLQPTYYKAMAQAEPAVIQQEILFTLAQIHNDLYELHMDSERMLAMSSLTGLQAGAISNVMLIQTVKDISKQINCWYQSDDFQACTPPKTSPQ